MERCKRKKAPRERGFFHLNKMSRRGLEPPRGCPHQPLKLARLPFRHRDVELLECLRRGIEYSILQMIQRLSAAPVTNFHNCAPNFMTRT